MNVLMRHYFEVLSRVLKPTTYLGKIRAYPGEREEEKLILYLRNVVSVEKYKKIL